MRFPGRERPRVVAISRAPAYSPQQHARNDSAILDLTLGELESFGWSACRLSEAELRRGALPAAELYLNMGQGVAGARILLEHEALGVRFFNRPSSVLRCHRHHLVRALGGGTVPFPVSIVVRTSAPLTSAARAELATFGPGPVWLKRGDVHAERPEDVLMVGQVELERELAAFASRGIALAVIQAHVPGPVVKFYGVAGRGLFHAYFAETRSLVTAEQADPEALRTLAFRAAARLHLDIFGGDIVLVGADRPVLIDFNDWPSFAPIRERAARAIAEHVHAHRPRGALR